MTSISAAERLAGSRRRTMEPMLHVHRLLNTEDSRDMHALRFLNV